MKTKIKIIQTLVSVSVLAIISNGAWALGTEADTSINNRASISYSVGGTAQTAINSSPTGNSDPSLCTAALPADGSAPPVSTICATTFEVDKKVDLLVTANSPVNVAALATGAPTDITFTVRNEGNSDETFDLATTGTVTGDNFDTSGCVVTVPSPSTAVPIAQDTDLAVTVQCAIPDIDPTNVNGAGIVINGNTSDVDLLASANVAAETTGAEDADTVDVVYADDAGTVTDSPVGAVSGNATRNAKHSATNTYTINTADLTVQKVSTVLNDPFNLTVNPKRIPGAEIQYTITVANDAAANTATAIVLSDVVPSDLETITATISGGTSGVVTVTGQNVASDPFTLLAGETATLLINAFIK